MLFLLLLLAKSLLPLAIPSVALLAIPGIHYFDPHWGQSYAASLIWMWIAKGLASFAIPALNSAAFDTLFWVISGYLSRSLVSQETLVFSLRVLQALASVSFAVCEGAGGMILLVSSREWLLGKIKEDDTPGLKPMILGAAGLFFGASGFFVFNSWASLGAEPWPMWALGACVFGSLILGLRNLISGNTPFILDGALLVFLVSLQLWVGISGGTAELFSFPTLISALHRLLLLLLLVTKITENLENEEAETAGRMVWAMAKPLVLLVATDYIFWGSSEAGGSSLALAARVLGAVVTLGCYLVDQGSEDAEYFLIEEP